MNTQTDPLLDTEAAAKFLNVTASFLNKARSCGGGPRFVKIGGHLVRYKPTDLLTYIEEGTHERIAPRRRRVTLPTSSVRGG